MQKYIGIIYGGLALATLTFVGTILGVLDFLNLGREQFFITGFLAIAAVAMLIRALKEQKRKPHLRRIH